MKFHHIGIACESISLTLDGIKKLHDVDFVSQEYFDDKQQASVLLITLKDGTNLELVSGKIVASLVKKKISMYHICYEVEDIEGEIQRAKEKGALVISTPKESILFDGRRVAFLMYPYGMVEYLEAA